MNNKRKVIALVIVGTLALVALLLTGTGAWAGPGERVLAGPLAPTGVVSSTLSYQGRLLDAGGDPLDDTYGMTFRLYDVPTGGTALWTQVQNVEVEDGLFNAHLDVNASLFDGQALWLGVQVTGDTEMSPRQPLLPAPYALHALAAPWSGLTGVPTGLNDGDDDTLGELLCSSGQIAEWNGSLWVCGDDDVGSGGGGGDITAVYAGTGLSGGGTSGAVTLNADTTYLQRRVSATCAAGSSIRIINADGTVTCEDDDDTTYSNGTGLNLAGNQFSVGTTYRLPQSCAGGQIAEWNGSSWQCGNDDTGTGGGAWSLTGNSGTDPAINFLGTTDGVSLTLVVNSASALRLEPNATSPNLIGGYGGNSVDAGVVGAVIDGGGSSGYLNRVMADYGTVGGGVSNVGGGDSSTIGGGGANTAGGINATIGGGYYSEASGDYATVGGGSNNTAGSDYATVGGGFNNTALYYATVAGGRSNDATDLYASVGGGYSNEASGNSATVSGGAINEASGDSATVGGGEYIDAAGQAATVAGGSWITATGDYAAVGGGWHNTANGPQATVGGGSGNTASGPADTVGGGLSNEANGGQATVGGGAVNEASGWLSTVGGGWVNTASGDYATVGGGNDNTASAWYATVGGGHENIADYLSTVGGGASNTASGDLSTIGGGEYINVSGQAATVAGGSWITATGDYAAVGGGYNNIVTGTYATVPGGYGNTASGDYSFAAGDQAKATHDGSFVWSSWVTTESWGDYTFTAAADGGARFWSGTSTGVQLSSGGTSWGSISDRNAKENFADVDATRVLETLAAMPIQTWNLKAQLPDMRHIGPVAQDFNGEFAYLFGEVESPTHINNMDAIGVAMVAVQGLYANNQALETEVSTLRTENADLQAKVDDLEARVAALEAAVGSPQASGFQVSSIWLALGGLAAVAAVVGRRRLGGRR